MLLSARRRRRLRRPSLLSALICHYIGARSCRLGLQESLTWPRRGSPGEQKKDSEMQQVGRQIEATFLHAEGSLFSRVFFFYATAT